MSTLPPSPTIPRPTLAPLPSPSISDSSQVDGVSPPNEPSANTSPTIHRDEFVQCYQQLRDIFQNQSGFTNLTILSSVTQVIHVVEVTTTLPGPEKKTLVLDLIRKLIIDTTTVGSNARQGGLLLLETVVPSSIDIFISVATGEVEIGKITPQIIQAGCCGGGAPH